VLQTVNGGAGDDAFWVEGLNASDRLVLEGGAGANSLVLRYWNIPDVYLNQAHAGPGVVALNVQTIQIEEAQKVYGGDLAERYTSTYRNEWIDAGGGNDVIVADTRDDFFYGNDTVFGGTGDDTVTDYGGANYLRGGAGDDRVQGGAGFDDAHGNEGNDTVLGGAGDDWTVGGKDDDLLDGEAGADIVYGNLGNDTAGGGEGDDIVRGGQGSDSVSGGSGADWLSGDRGDDTLTGGAGADVFHTFAEAGLDRVLDFNAAEGDRVQLLPGASWTAAQVGADVVVATSPDAQLVLVNVQLSSLPAGWIFGA
jgi:Ca2+-binding RTX toxin-like protein